MKGIILAGGNGTRLRPLTLVANKHLLPVYNKPMILYPLQTLKDMGIKDILIVSGGENIGVFMDFLGDGSDYGVSLTYKIQKEAGGIAQALLLGKDFVGQDRFAVILGDNIFEYAPKLPLDDLYGIVLKKVANPERFGVFDKKTCRITEKPKKPKSKFAVTGLYFYQPSVFSFIEKLKPSKRGEMEITDVNNWCLEHFDTATLDYEGFWSDAGTFDSLLASSNFIKSKTK